MKPDTNPIIFEDEKMISIDLSNGSFEVNEELIPIVGSAVTALGISTTADLKQITEEDFFAIFTPLMNLHYGLG